VSESGQPGGLRGVRLGPCADVPGARDRIDGVAQRGAGRRGWGGGGASGSEVSRPESWKNDVNAKMTPNAEISNQSSRRHVVHGEKHTQRRWVRAASP
jgi:hypothetical protein